MAFDITAGLVKQTVTDNEKEMIIAEALETDEGRLALAQAMVDPIRRALEYQCVGRKCLLVDELPQGALPRYERDPACVAHVISKKGGVPQQQIDGEEVVVPLFEIAAHPSIRLSEIKARRFYIVDRAQIKAKEALQKSEDENIFKALIAAATNRNDQIVTDVGSLSPSGLNTAFRNIEIHDLVAVKIVMHAWQYSTVRTFGKDFYDEATTHEILGSGLFGHLYTADIHVSSRMPYDQVLVLASPDTVGAFPIRQDISVLPADDPSRLRVGWVVYEEVGVCVVNDYAISLIEVLPGSGS